MKNQKLFRLILLIITLYSMSFGKTSFKEGEKLSPKVQRLVIADFRAVGDGKTICTASIKKGAP